MKVDRIVKYLDDSLIDLKSSVNNKESPKNKKLSNTIKIAEKIINFDKQQKCRGLKILYPKQMPQRLPIALAQVKAGNAS